MRLTFVVLAVSSVEGFGLPHQHHLKRKLPIVRGGGPQQQQRKLAPVVKMSTRAWAQVLSGACVIGTSLVGGVFLSFSDFLMRALNKVGEPAGSAAMKSINVEVFRIIFIPLFFALVPGTVATAAVSATGNDTGPARPWLLAASVIYCFGVFLVTGAGNVPLNNKLAALDGTAQTQYWRSTYLPKWTRLNTIRTIACIVSATCSLIGFGLLGAPR